MLLPIRNCRRIVCVGVAVVAEVRAGVVLADVLRHDATTGEALAFVFQFCVNIVGDNPAIATLLLGRAEHIALDELRADKLHELGIVIEALRNQSVVDTAVVFDAVLIKVFDLAACRRRNAPTFRQFADS